MLETLAPADAASSGILNCVVPLRAVLRALVLDIASSSRAPAALVATDAPVDVTSLSGVVGASSVPNVLQGLVGY